MSTGVPIYQRILYGSTGIHSKGQSEGDQSSRLQALSIDQSSNSIKVTGKSEVQQFTRQSMSAPSLPFTSVSSVEKGKHIIPRLLTSAPSSSISLTKYNTEYQSERWKDRQRNLLQSRTLKRTSNVIPHRQDKGYYISGSRVPLIDRYDIDEDELVKLRMLAHSRAHKSSSAGSGSSSSFQRKFNPGVSPSGQNCSPVPPSAASETDKKKKFLEKRSTPIEEREEQREMERKRKKEKEKRMEEKRKFEKEMEEKYQPKIPVQKSMIFVTENNDDSKQQQRVFLTEGDFMDEEKGAVYSFVNEKQRKTFANIFNDIDKNKDGKVDMQELKQQLFPLVSKKQLKNLLQVFDLNKDHTVDVREFVTICALNDQLCRVRTEDDTASLALDVERLAQHITIYKELFDVVDEDGDGRLQSDEVLLMVITAIEGENQMDVEESKRILDSVEKDENGFIDFVSFLSYIPFFVKLLKVIMDSPLSIASLERVRDKVMRKFSRNTTHSS